MHTVRGNKVVIAAALQIGWDCQVGNTSLIGGYHHSTIPHA